MSSPKCQTQSGAELSATVGSFGTYNTTADVTGPISSQLQWPPDCQHRENRRLA